MIPGWVVHHKRLVCPAGIPAFFMRFPETKSIGSIIAKRFLIVVLQQSGLRASGA
jgi:hypothetical protein